MKLLFAYPCLDWLPSDGNKLYFFQTIISRAIYNMLIISLQKLSTEPDSKYYFFKPYCLAMSEMYGWNSFNVR